MENQEENQQEEKEEKEEQEEKKEPHYLEPTKYQITQCCQNIPDGLSSISAKKEMSLWTIHVAEEQI